MANNNCNTCYKKESARRYAWRSYFKGQEHLLETHKEVVGGLRTQYNTLQALKTMAKENDIKMPDDIVEKLKTIKSSLECPVCKELLKKITVEITPCNHRVCCHCIDALKECPKCKTKITKRKDKKEDGSESKQDDE